MPSKLSGAYVVITYQNVKERSRFARLKGFLISIIIQFLYSFRKNLSKIIINGKPVIADPDDVPTAFKKLSIKQLRQLKKSLDIISKNGANGSNRDFFRPGFVPPASSPDHDDLVIEIISSTDVALKNVSDHDAVDALRETEADIEEFKDASAKSIEAFQKPKRKPRPKAAKGCRGDMVIPPYVIIDDDREIPAVIEKKSRPKAAKGKRATVDEPELIDLPAEILFEKLKNQNDRPHFDATTRRRPLAARRHRAEHTQEILPGSVVQEDENLRDKDNISTHDILVNDLTPMHGTSMRDSTSIQDTANRGNTSTKKRLVRPLAARGERTIPLRTEREYIRQHKVTVADSTDSQEEESDDGDIFNVPYLPKSQRMYATALKLPWEK